MKRFFHRYVPAIEIYSIILWQLLRDISTTGSCLKPVASQNVWSQPAYTQSSAFSTPDTQLYTAPTDFELEGTERNPIE